MLHQGFYFKIRITPKFSGVYEQYSRIVSEKDSGRLSAKNLDRKEKENIGASSDRPSFIRVAPGAKIDGLTLVNNSMIGNADFIDNQGELTGAIFTGNKHIVKNNPSPKEMTGVNWTKWGAIFTVLGIVVSTILWALGQNQGIIMSHLSRFLP